MLTIVAGGLRKYLDSKGELPQESLVTGCPIDVRSPEERAAGGNMVGFMNVALRTDIADRLRATGRPCTRRHSPPRPMPRHWARALPWT